MRQNFLVAVFQIVKKAAGDISPNVGEKRGYYHRRALRLLQALVLPTGKAAELASNASAGNSRVNIYVDSQAAIKVITVFRISARSVLGSRADTDIGIISEAFGSF